MIDRLKQLFHIQRTRAAYRSKFGDASDLNTRAVLGDFGRFCHARNAVAPLASGSGQVDPIALAMIEGRREAFYYLVRQANRTDNDIDQAIQEEITDAT